MSDLLDTRHAETTVIRGRQTVSRGRKAPDVPRGLPFLITADERRPFCEVGAIDTTAIRGLTAPTHFQTCRPRINRRAFLRATGGMLMVGLVSDRGGAAAEGGKWGDLVGRLVYDGPAPDRKNLKVDKDIEFCGKFDIRDESLLIGPDGGLANVYVYVRDREVPICPDLGQSADRRVTLDNRDAIFHPHCLTIWHSRQELRIVNSDPIAQNVAFSPLGDAAANIVMPVGGEATYKFARKQNTPVKIACNYHPWESAYILPRDNPYTAISRADGRFRIERLPVGTWDFQAWQERLTYLDTPDWPKGRFRVAIRPGVNDLGTIKLSPTLWGDK